MINSIKIAFRNTLRNKRRTLLSVLAIAIGGFASLLIGSFVITINQSIQTGVARSSGNLHIHQKGFFDFGAGTVGEYDIKDYQEIIDKIKNSDISKYINVITPTLKISGIAGNYAKNSSQTFMGVGLIAKDQHKMQSWDGYNLNLPTDNKAFEKFKGGGLIGQGLAINLSLCKELNIEGCKEKKKEINSSPIDEDIASFALEVEASDDVIISLLASSSKGVPNIVKLPIDSVWKQNSSKELDDRFIALSLKTAQMLVYGSDTKAVDTINIQLKMPEDIDLVASKLDIFFKKNSLNLEIIKLETFHPEINKVLNMFGVIFGFVSAIIGLIAVFTVSNTMTMSIMERYNEIGTIRALGLKRAGVRTYFLLEGTIIGIFGATLGVILAIISTFIINNVKFMWTPPSASSSIQLILHLLDNITLIFGVWMFLVIISIVSTLLPAIRASKMQIVDALRYN